MVRSSSNRRRCLALATACALVSGYTHHAQGQTFNVSWVGPSTGLYGTPSNWSTNIMPNNNTALADFFNVTINRAGGSIVTLNADPTILNLTIGANAGNQLHMGDTRTLTLIGASGGGPITVSNAGTINLGGTAAATANLFLNGTSANLSGGGTITMFGNSVLSGAGTVTSNNTIIGLGNLGNDTIAFINNGTVTANGGSLTLDARTSGGFVNNGLLQALAGGTMVFSGNGGGSFTNTAATISVAAATGRINLMDGATIVGGTISTAGLNSSIFFVPTGHTATLSGLTSTADVNVAIGSTLNLVGTITNNSRIRTNSSVGVATFNTGAATVTLNGTGSLVLSQLAGAEGNLLGTGTFVNGATHTIAGAGTIGSSSLRLANDGTITANLNGQVLVMEPTGLATNTGTLEARNGGILRLVGPASISSGLGDIVAADANSVVELAGGVQIFNGTFSGPGAFRVPSGSTAILGGGTNNGNLSVLNSASLEFTNTVTNNGTISLLSTGGIADFHTDSGGTIALNGNGTVIMSGTGAQLTGISGGTVVNNNNIIRGQGAIGLNAIAMVNRGTISADVPSNILLIDPGAGGLINSGTLEARDSANLALSGAGGGAITNTGTIQAVTGGPSAVVSLLGGVVINGGTLKSDVASFFTVTGGGGGAAVNAITNLGTLRVQGNAALNVGTSMFNSGTVDVQGTGTAAQLLLSGGTVTLDGSGTVLLRTTGLASTVFGGSGTLNNLNNLIHGSGRLGNNTISIRNAGTISADINSRTLVVDPDVGVWTNTGTMLAANGGILELNGTGGGILLGNTGGRIIATNESSVRLRGVSINGGTLASSNTGSIAVASTSTATIGFLTNTGNVVIGGDGVGSTLTIDGTVTNTGTISITPGDSATATVQTLAGSTLNNDGTILLRKSNANNSVPFLQGAGVLNNNGLIRGDGVIAVDLSAATFTINNAGAIESDGFGLAIASLSNPPPIVVINNTGVIRTRPGANNASLGNNLQITGSGSLDILANSAAQSFSTISTPTVALNGALLQAGNPASFGNIDGTGTLIVGTPFFTGVVPGIVTMNRLRGLSVVAVQAGTLTTIAGRGTLGTSLIEGTLSIGSSGPARWNLTDHDLILDYAGATALPNVQNHIASARNAGSWNGSGLTSTTARDNPVHNTTLGAIEASDFFAATGTTTFSGQTVDGTSVLVKYTYYGDTDFNGVVNFDDYSRTDAGFNNQRSGWFNGDFDFNGVVDFDDYSLIDLAFNSQSGVLARAMSYLDGNDRSDHGMNAPALRLVQDHFAQFGNAYAGSFLNAVPEPSSSALVLTGICAAIGQRRRRRVI